MVNSLQSIRFFKKVLAITCISINSYTTSGSYFYNGVVRLVRLG